MFEPNVVRILDQIGESDNVLDVGGWWRPFNRANWVVDIQPYQSRGVGGYQGPEVEHFSEGTWVQRDLCSREPFPFADKSFDYAICSHTLEDIRDPIFLCEELMRVAKRGYIEVPSVTAELSLGSESKHFAGYSHHRWIIEIVSNGVTFFHKPHFMHTKWRFHLPYSYGVALPPAERVQWLFWDGTFEAREMVMIDYEGVLRYVGGLVEKRGVYPAWRYRVDSLGRHVKKLVTSTR